MVQFNSEHWKTQIFPKKFCSELAGDLQEKLLKATNKVTSQTTKNCYAKTSCNVSSDFELSNPSEEVIKKILISLNTGKAAGMNQIPAKFLRDDAEVSALPLRNIIKLSIKLPNHPSHRKVKLLS